MISRRRFLEVGSVAAGLAAVSHPLLASGAPGDEKPGESSLPPSLARLKSRKSEATPITREERHERQERARKLMSENALDAIVLMEGTSLQILHRHSLVGRRAHVRAGAAGKRRGVLCVSRI